LLSLFKNIVAQNLIIEACIVAEYLIEEAEKNQRSLLPMPTERKKSWFAKLLGL